MLASLSIKNFSLIEDLEVSFSSGLSILTGETGSGKSILLEALSLILGQRADLSTIRSGANKCIVEATFEIGNHNVHSLFEALDLDHEPITIVRRELSASGKSRAFVNDTPVTLDALKSLRTALVDMHTQRQTIQLTDPAFYLKLIDAFTNDDSLLLTYKNEYAHWKKCSNALSQLRQRQQQSSEALDYHKFLLQELEQVSLSPKCIETLEEEASVLRNATALRATLAEAVAVGTQENIGAQDQLNTLAQLLAKISSLGEAYASLQERILSIGIEFSDVLQEAQQLGESISDDPARLQEVEDNLSTLHQLCQKHKVQNAEGLIEKRDELQQLCSDVEQLDDQISACVAEVATATKKLHDTAQKLRLQRENACQPLTNALVSRTRDLGMQHVRFAMNMNPLPAPSPDGTEEAELLFSANKGIDFAPMGKVASGGELSRIMLVIKSIMAEKTQLPTLILDEIDTGVSGEMANAMGKRMYEMSRHMQVISITHLPQIAALADAHYKVYKDVVGETTQTFLIPLDEDARIEELAEMLGGKDIKESALRHAQELRNV
ncbi:MAG: DNA repair protein RecN [Bacteroidetes bacterium]|nr:DNA repair protein RecN [Bacteroidota bacterium]